MADRDVLILGVKDPGTSFRLALCATERDLNRRNTFLSVPLLFEVVASRVRWLSEPQTARL